MATADNISDDTLEMHPLPNGGNPEQGGAAPDAPETLQLRQGRWNAGTGGSAQPSWSSLLRPPKRLQESRCHASIGPLMARSPKPAIKHI